MKSLSKLIRASICLARVRSVLMFLAVWMIAIVLVACENKPAKISHSENIDSNQIPIGESGDSTNVEEIRLVSTSLDDSARSASVDGLIELQFNSDITVIPLNIKLVSENGIQVPISVANRKNIITLQASEFLAHNTGYQLLIRRQADEKISNSASVPALKQNINFEFTTARAEFEGYLASEKKPRNLLLQSEKRVFAHYFPPFPRMINDNLPGEDYYDRHYLNPEGEDEKFLAQGGYLRFRPIIRAPFNKSDWSLTDARFEVRQAASIGLDGFSIDILDVEGSNWERVKRIFTAAEEIGDFKILIMPDMNAIFKSRPEYFIPIIEKLAEMTASYRLDDGRLVLSPYLAENYAPSWWRKTLDDLEARGISVALVPVYQGWKKHLENFKVMEPEAFDKYVIGVSDWGPRTPSGAENLRGATSFAHAYGKLWMAPVSPQDSRPKSAIYSEAGNSEAFRKMWENAIRDDADWVQIITWNDYSESTSIAPSSQIGYSFYDLNSYYIDWFKSGQQPRIVRDVIYSFYREHSTEAMPQNRAFSMHPMRSVNNESPRNEIEMLAFMEAPGTLEIEINEDIYQKIVSESGVVSFKVPLKEGKPVFRILRNGIVKKQLVGLTEISNNIAVQDMTYHGAVSSRSLEDKNNRSISWPRKSISSSTNKILPTNEFSPFSRVSNTLSNEFLFNCSEPDEGFSYHFLPSVDDVTTKFMFDLNLRDLCIHKGALTVSLASDRDDGVVIELCGTETNYGDVINKDASGAKSLAESRLRPNSWYGFSIIVNRENRYYKNFDLSIKSPDGSEVKYQKLELKNKVSELSSIRFTLEKSAVDKASIIVDNVGVASN